MLVGLAPAQWPKLYRVVGSFHVSVAGMYGVAVRARKRTQHVLLLGGVPLADNRENDSADVVGGYHVYNVHLGAGRVALEFVA